MFNDTNEQLGFLLGEEPSKVIMLVTLKNDVRKVIFQKEVDEQKAEKDIYLVSVDKTIHGKYAGLSANSKKYYKFTINLEPEEHFQLIYDEFSQGENWQVNYDSAHIISNTFTN